MKLLERASDLRLPARLPVIIRVDGRAFHTYTRKLPRPWCAKLAAALDQVALRLCEEIQGARLAYQQSDEISVLVHGYAKHESQPWVSNRVQKMASLAAGIASAEMTRLSPSVFGEVRPAVFDARAFVLSEAEVCNYFWWRQQDATRNSIQQLAQSLYSQRELHGKAQPELQELCWAKGKNWNDLPVYWRRGRCAVRVDGGWAIDSEIPIWKGEGRAYVEQLLVTEEESAA
jgi:tRNA(His) 5'-end guanylyltransferase